jgi:hypothetical protein
MKDLKAFFTFIVISFILGFFFKDIVNEIKLISLVEEDNGIIEITKVVTHDNKLKIINEDGDLVNVNEHPIGFSIFNEYVKDMIDRYGRPNKKTSENILIYYYLIKYSEQFDVPLDIAFAVAKAESGYHGLFHWDYNSKVKSSANAYGVMQIRIPTANEFHDSTLTKEDLLNNPELNIMLSMKILKHNKDKYGSWELALGAYNTGKPKINTYSEKIVNFSLIDFFDKDFGI